MIRADRVVGSIGAIRIGSEAEEMFLRIIASAGPRLEMQVVAGEPRKGQSRFNGVVAAYARGCPEIERAHVLEQPAVTKTETVREAASNGERPELRVEALAVEDEDPFRLSEVDRTLDATCLIRLRLCGFFLTPFAVGIGAGRRFLRKRDICHETREGQREHAIFEHRSSLSHACFDTRRGSSTHPTDFTYRLSESPARSGSSTRRTSRPVSGARDTTAACPDRSLPSGREPYPSRCERSGR